MHAVGSYIADDDSRVSPRGMLACVGSCVDWDSGKALESLVCNGSMGTAVCSCAAVFC